MANIELPISCACSSFQSACTTECALGPSHNTPSHATQLSSRISNLGCSRMAMDTFTLLTPCACHYFQSVCTISMLRSHVLLCVDAACTPLRYTSSAAHAVLLVCRPTCLTLHAPMLHSEE